MEFIRNINLDIDPIDLNHIVVDNQAKNQIIPEKSNMTIEETLKQNRPLLSDASLRTYKSILSNLYKRVFPNDTEINVSKFGETEKFLEYLKTTPYNKRKTQLASLVVISGKQEYNILMMDDIKKYKENELKQEKTETQTENWLEFSEVQKVVENQAKVAKGLFSKTDHTIGELQQIQNYILLCLTTGYFIEPRRSMDWIMKFKNYDEASDNYVDMKENKFVFQRYKTGKTYAKKEVEIPKKLKAILTKWIKINPCDYLIFDKYKKPITSALIVDRLNNVFGKQISTSMLRHIYATNKFDHVNLQDIVDASTAMGNSPLQLLEYVKREKSEKK